MGKIGRYLVRRGLNSLDYAQLRITQAVETL